MRGSARVALANRGHAEVLRAKPANDENYGRDQQPSCERRSADDRESRRGRCDSSNRRIVRSLRGSVEDCEAGVRGKWQNCRANDRCDDDFRSSAGRHANCTIDVCDLFAAVPATSRRTGNRLPGPRSN